MLKLKMIEVGQAGLQNYRVTGFHEFKGSRGQGFKGSSFGWQFAVCSWQKKFKSFRVSAFQNFKVRVVECFAI
jgi:hypothetical protein